MTGHEQALAAAKKAFYREMDAGLGVENAIDAYLKARNAEPVAWTFTDSTGCEFITMSRSQAETWPTSTPLFSESPSPLPHVAGWRLLADDAKDAGRVLLLWEPFGDIEEHIELGRWSPILSKWVNTYGKAFSSAPHRWSPLAPYSPADQMRVTDSFGNDLIERELVSIVLRMSRHLLAVDTPAAKKLNEGALDYLRRKGLMPSPLRADETVVQSETEGSGE